PRPRDLPPFPTRRSSDLVPIPSSRLRSEPTRVTRLRTSGPEPISVAPLTGAVTRPSSIRYAWLAENTNLPLVMSTWPPPNATARSEEHTSELQSRSELVG